MSNEGFSRTYMWLLLPVILMVTLALAGLLRLAVRGRLVPAELMPTPSPEVTEEATRVVPTSAATGVQATIVALANTLTAIPVTSTPTETPAPTPTASSTMMPTPTPAAQESATEPLPHVFPLAPAEAVSYGHWHHDYPATDIFAPEGTRFLAVTNGVIEEVSRDDLWSVANDGLCTRGGRYVSLVGDDGVRYYGSHLFAVAPGIEPGVRVEAGQRLGRVGNSGNARGVDPHLHFGISRPTGANDCGTRRGEFWPYEYLNNWKAGVNVVPTLPE